MSWIECRGQNINQFFYACYSEFHAATAFQWEISSVCWVEFLVKIVKKIQEREQMNVFLFGEKEKLSSRDNDEWLGETINLSSH